MEIGETCEAALARELQEELGVTPTTFSFLCKIEGAATQGAAETWWLYEVTAWAGEPRLANAEHTRIEWVDLADAQQLEPLASEAYRSVFASLGQRLESGSD